MYNRVARGKRQVAAMKSANSMLRELQNIILLHDWRQPTGRTGWSVGILGAVIALIGIILALGGAKLIGVGGSWYYLFAGLALIVAGLAIAQRKLLGAWIYAGAFVVTALWAFWEVGLNGWALVPRLVGPLVLLLLLILSLYWTRTAGVGEGCSDSAALRSL